MLSLAKLKLLTNGNMSRDIMTLSSSVRLNSNSSQSNLQLHNKNAHVTHKNHLKTYNEFHHNMIILLRQLWIERFILPVAGNNGGSWHLGVGSQKIFRHG